ncbi:MAG: LPS export ABC transporter permease LptG [Pseudomonadota bacterium]
MTWTLGLYIARRFLRVAILAFVAVFILVVIIDLVERMNQNSDGNAGFVDLIGMAFLHAPVITIAAAPFTVLLASMACFAWLARSSELVVTRAAGVSVWAVLTPAVLSAALLGVLTFSVYNPVSAAFAERFQALEERYFGRSSSSLSVSAEGLWLRQGGRAGQTVIRADRASTTIQRLWGVSVFQFDEEDRLVSRLEARTAVLEVAAWRLNAVRRWDFADVAPAPDDDEGAVLETKSTSLEELRLATDLTPERIQESFAAPNTIGFWELPQFIALLDESGFSSARHRMHWHSLLAIPVVFCAMVLIGAAFSMRHVRFGGLGAMALGCVFAGFGYFFLSDLAQALGASGTVPVLVAAWAPPTAAVLFALGLLLQLEDG